MEQTRLRFWQRITVGLALVGMAIGTTRSVVAQSQKQRFTEIDVERINVLEADGTVPLPEVVRRGRERLTLIVTAGGDARIEFLDNSGKPTAVLPAQR